MNAYLIKCNHFLVFACENPLGRCSYPIVPDVHLSGADLAEEPPGHPATGLCVGIDPTDDYHFRIFPTMSARAHEGFHQVVGIPVVVQNWIDFVRAAVDTGEIIDLPNTDSLFGESTEWVARMMEINSRMENPDPETESPDRVFIM